MCSSTLFSPEQEKAYAILKENLPNFKSMLINEMPQKLETNYKAFSKKNIGKDDLPHEPWWVWNQSNGKVERWIHDNIKVTIQKFNPRKKLGHREKKASYKLWLYTLSNRKQEHQLSFVWCEKGFYDLQDEEGGRTTTTTMMTAAATNSKHAVAMGTAPTPMTSSSSSSSAYASPPSASYSSSSPSDDYYDEEDAPLYPSSKDKSAVCSSPEAVAYYYYSSYNQSGGSNLIGGNGSNNMMMMGTTHPTNSNSGGGYYPIPSRYSYMDESPISPVTTYYPTIQTSSSSSSTLEYSSSSSTSSSPPSSPEGISAAEKELLAPPPLFSLPCKYTPSELTLESLSFLKMFVPPQLAMEFGW